MKRIITILAAAIVVLSTSGLLLAQGATPYSGTWKVNTAKTRETGIFPLPKASQVIVAANAGAYEVISKGTGPDGQPFTFKYSFPAKGGPITFSDGFPGGVTGAATLPNPGVIDMTVMLDGKPFLASHSVLKARTLLWTFKGADEQGKPFELVESLDKQ